MGNIFRVINYDGDIEISIYKKANAVFKTNEYSETEDVCVHKETINIFDLLKENQFLKKQLEENQNPLKGIFAQVNDDTLLRDCGNMNAEIKELKNQQKEFIEYLEKTIEELECEDVDDEEMKGYLIQRTDTFKEIFFKYKEIIVDE